MIFKIDQLKFKLIRYLIIKDFEELNYIALGKLANAH